MHNISLYSCSHYTLRYFRAGSKLHAMSKTNKMERYDRRCNKCQCEKCAYIRDGIYLLLRAGKAIVIFCVVAVPALMLLFAILSFLPTT